MTLVRLLLLIFGVTAAATGQPLVAYHTTLFDHVDPLPGGGIKYSSLTGYVAPDGREYALLGGVEATYIYDITTAPVRLVARLFGPFTEWREIKTYREHAYVVTDACWPRNGLQIIDLSTLPDTARVLREDTTSFTMAHTLTRDGDYLYVHGTNAVQGGGGTLIFDLASDPLHPKPVGKYALRYVHDAAVRNDTLYAAAINNGQLDIVYLGKDRKEPKLIAEVRYPGAGTHSADLTADGSYVLTADEINQTPKTLKVWDVRDMENITKVADYTPVPGEIIHNVHVKGTAAYASWYTAGTRIIDISDPRAPVQVGYYDTFEGAVGGMLGNWEVYPYLPSGKLLASDRLTGLYVFTFDGVKKGSTSGRVLDAVTDEPISGATIELPSIGMSATSGTDGAYSFSGASDTLRAIVSAAGYVKLTDSVMPTPTGSERDFRLEPINSGVDEVHRAIGCRSISIGVGAGEREGWIAIGEEIRHVRVELVDRLGAVGACLADIDSGNGPMRVRFDLDGLAAGAYFWRALDGSGAIIDSGSLILR